MIQLSLYLQPLDGKMLFLLLESLVSEANQLDSQDQPKWMARVDLFRPLIEQLLDSVGVSADDLSQFFLQCW